ncbi:FtsX-like permease family protein [Enemella sp. A6]|uniref:ABC transporter permease n=1 Tax=Enemella sp. A6 TaxID=3440152 RepID=UPI003EC11E22
MVFRMVRADVRRNPALTGTLVVLMMMSVMLACASAGLLARAVGAGDRLLATADAPDVAQMHAGPMRASDIEAWAGRRDDVAAHQTQLLLGIDNAQLWFDQESQAQSIQQNSLVVPNGERDLLLDLQGRPITEVAPGTIWLPVIYQVEHGLQPGATVTVTAPDGFRHELRVAGFMRDSIMNTGIASSKRLAVHPDDLAAVRAHTGTPEYLISFWLTDPAELEPFKKAYLDSGLPHVGPMIDSAAFRAFNMISEGLVAGVVILGALMLMIVGLLCLRLAFRAAIHNDRREIGVLTAVGVPTRAIKGIYLAKYGSIGAAASLFGLFAGWALAPAMSRNLDRYLGESGGFAPVLVPVLVAVAAFGLIMVSLHTLLRRFNRLSAVEALRSGTVGSGGGRAPVSLHSSVLPTQVTLGVIDLLKRPLMYVLLLVVFMVSAFIVVVPTSAATTLRAPQFMTNLGVGDADLGLTLQHAGQQSASTYAEVLARLSEDHDVAEYAALITTRHDLTTSEGEPVSLYVANGDHAILPVTYAEGRAPTAEHEIAVSLLALAQLGHRVGDTITLDVDGHPRDLTIVGSYQDITHGGKTARAMLPTKGAEVMWYSFAVKLQTGVDAEAKATAYRVSGTGLRSWTMSEFRDQQLGPISRQVTGAAVISVGVAVALAAMITVMFTRMLLAGDTAPIAIQRALGAGDSGIRTQYLTRILVVLLLGVPLGIVAALTAGQAMFNLMFEGMFGGLEFLFRGTSRIEFVSNPLLSAVALPAVLLLTVAAATVASCTTITRTTINSLVRE